jgi:Cu(I)/Ag(I) efflux system membrane fusion protein
VRLEAYESQLPWLRFGQEIEFTIDSLPGTVFEGQISFIDPVIDPSTRTVRVRLNVDNDDGRLKPGMFVRAAARSRIAGEGLVIDESLRGKWISPMHPEVIKDGPGECDVCGMPLVPIEEYGYLVSADEHGPPLVIYATAPLITGRRAVVFVQVPDAERPTFEMREIVLGPRAGEQYIVASGLEEGEQVVVHGGFKIDSALQLARRPSMMSASGAAATATTVESPTEFLAALGPVFEAYFGAQEALAADDLGAFRSASGALHAAVDEVTVTGLAGEARGRWRRIADGLLTDRAHLDHLDGIEAARALFETYANAAIELDRTFGHAGADAHYVTHCPMAFDFRGASWLARVAEISNPYFGASMLRCGAIKETLAGTHAGDGEDGP